MKLLSSLDRQDRKLLLWFAAVGLSLAVLLGFLLPGANSNDNPLPSTYLSGQHGARAAYETLLRANYPIERWERPLSELAATAGSDTVVIFAQPFTREPEDIKAVRMILERGGRVLSTGFMGAFILPRQAAAAPEEFTFAACKLEPEGLDPLASSGEVWMVPQATWAAGNPAQRVQYSCASQPAVVEYDWGKGHAVWWASSTPLENGSLARAQNLDLLLNSLGPREGRHFYWDESLHGDVRSVWSYASGPALTLLWTGLPVLGLLIVFSFSRRAGPLRTLPPPVRATPIEYLQALGSLYRNAGAASTAVAVAWERFKRLSLRSVSASGFKSQPMDATELAAVLHRRFPGLDRGPDDDLAADLVACEQAAQDEALNPLLALKLIQTLDHRWRQLIAAARPGNSLYDSEITHSHPHERAS